MIATIAAIAEKKKLQRSQRSQRSYKTTLQRSQRQQSLRYKKFYLSDRCCCDRWRVVRDTQRPGMFPNTPEVSQMVFFVLQRPVWLIWSCPNNYLFVRMSQGELFSSQKFQLAFSSHPKVLASLQGMKQPCFHRKLQGTFCLYTESFRRPFF